MKTRILLPMLALLTAAATTIGAQDNSPEYLGLPGDNLNLYAVMKIFQESETLEAFEKSLNDPANRINNLDLNGDNYVDYINVIDNVRGSVHYIILRVAINRNENQDVAVFTVERFNNGQVEIQLTGDENLYGRNYIIEPIYDDNIAGTTPNPGYAGNSVTVIRTTPVMIANWPIIRFIYRPVYIGWHSAWYWDYYPEYWHPWRPVYWHYYYGYHYNWYHHYYSHYRVWHTHRYAHWDDYYYKGFRVYSPTVRINIHSGHYSHTYSHPEERKRGEDAYHRNNPGQGRRSTYSTMTTSSGSSRTGERKIGDSETSRRTMSSVSTATSSGSNPEKSTNTISGRRTGTNPIATSRNEAPAVRSESKSISSERTVNRSTVSATKATAPASTDRRNDSWQPEKNNVSRERPVNTVSRSSETRPSNTQGRSSVASGSRPVADSKSVRSVSKSSETSKSETPGSSRRK